MARCFCPCHTHPGVYPPPCHVCGHDTREGRMIGTIRDGWEPHRPLSSSGLPLTDQEMEIDGLRLEVKRLQEGCDVLLADNVRLREKIVAFVEHHDNGQAGQPGHPKTYAEEDAWQAEWDQRDAALKEI
jgi:hypothetical protein